MKEGSCRLFTSSVLPTSLVLFRKCEMPQFNIVGSPAFRYPGEVEVYLVAILANLFRLEEPRGLTSVTGNSKKQQIGWRGRDILVHHVCTE